MKEDPDKTVAFTVCGGFWFHPECMPAVEPEECSPVKPGGGMDCYVYQCDGCGKNIDRVRPSQV